MLFLCQHGFESLLVGELGSAGLTAAEQGPGWALTGDGSAWPREQLADLAFPHLTLVAPRELKGESVNALAQQLGKARAPWRSQPQAMQAIAWVTEALERRLAA